MSQFKVGDGVFINNTELHDPTYYLQQGIIQQIIPPDKLGIYIPKTDYHIILYSYKVQSITTPQGNRRKSC